MKRILLLEDDKALNRGISLKLEKEGYEVLSAFSLKEAKALFQKGSIDLVISDITLSDGSGMDFCREVRQKAKFLLFFLLPWTRKWTLSMDMTVVQMTI